MSNLVPENLEIRTTAVQSQKFHKLLQLVNSSMVLTLYKLDYNHAEADNAELKSRFLGCMFNLAINRFIVSAMVAAKHM